VIIICLVFLMFSNIKILASFDDVNKKYNALRKDADSDYFIQGFWFDSYNDNAPVCDAVIKLDTPHV